jgi:VWFA-related protein
MRLGRGILVAGCIAVTMAGVTWGWRDAAAQKDKGDKDGTTTLQVYSRLTVVDVTATDASGQPVHGLTQSDFTLLEDGKPQPIRNFEEVKSQYVEPPRELPPNVYTNVSQPAPSSAVNILLMDFANEAPRDSTNPQQLARSTQMQHLVKQAALDAIDQMTPGTRVAILSMTNNLRILEGFTSNQAILKAAVNAAPYDLDGNAISGAGKSSNRNNTSTFDKNSGGGDQGVQADERNRMVLETFDQIAADVATMKGRKNLIWFTVGIPEITDPAQRPADLPDYTKGLDQAYDMLTAAQVSVYPVDAAGVTALSERQLSEEAVAAATGGVAYSGTNDMAHAVLKAIDNGANYYSIAYVPASAKNDGIYHKIEVKVDRPGVHMVFRQGYYADDVAKIKMPQGLTLSETAPIPHGGNMKAPMSRGLPTSSDLLFEVGVQPSTEAPKPGDPPILGTLDEKLQGKALKRYGFQYVVPSEQVKFTDGPKGTHKGALEFDVAVYDANDKLLTGISQTLKMPMSDAVYQELVGKHGPVRFFQQIDLPPGQLFVRVGVLDTTSEKVGTLELPLKVARR